MTIYDVRKLHSSLIQPCNQQTQVLQNYNVLIHPHFL
jgi:hypothetical protein